MKLGSRDKRYPILITGRELVELKKLTYLMAEAFGLDRRIENYQGKRPIGLYRWDLDCLIDVTELALADVKQYPRKSGEGYAAMQKLCDRLKRLSEQAYADIAQD